MMHWPTPGGASLSAALEVYLGLKLEARKAPIDVLVIGRVEKTPVENGAPSHAPLALLYI